MNSVFLMMPKINNLFNGDIVVFSVDGEDFSCMQYYKNDVTEIVSFQSDSDDLKFEPFVYRYKDADNVTIFGKVVYTVIL